MCFTRPLPVLKGHHELSPEPPPPAPQFPQLSLMRGAPAPWPPHGRALHPSSSPRPCAWCALGLCGAVLRRLRAPPARGAAPGLLQGGLSARVLWGVRQGWGARRSPDVPSIRMRGTGHKLEGRGCPVNIRMCYFTVWVTELIREVVEPPPLELFTPHLDVALGDLSQVSLPEQGWQRWTLRCLQPQPL